MMSEAEIVETAADIEANGLQEAIEDRIDDVKDPHAGPELLDGRGLLAALKRLKITDPRNAPYRSLEGKQAVRYLRARENPGINPWTYVLSKNVYRRRVNAEQKRDAIKRFLTADPQASNRDVGKKLGVSHQTVNEVRNEAVQSGQISQNEPPIEHAKTVLREDLNLTTRELAEKAGVSQGTAQKAKKLVAAESEPETKSEPKEKPVDPEQETKKKAEQFRATVRKTFAQWTKEWWTNNGLKRSVLTR